MFSRISDQKPVVALLVLLAGLSCVTVCHAQPADKGDKKLKKDAQNPQNGIKPAPLHADRATCKLPTMVRRLAVGGGGRYLIFSPYNSRKALYIFDVNAAKIVKELELDEFPIAVTAGKDHLFVVLPKGSSQSILQRFRLGTFQKEASAPGPSNVNFALMGSASTEPLLLGTWRGSNAKFFDPRTLKEIDTRKFVKGRYSPPDAFRVWRASADGRVFTNSRPNTEQTERVRDSFLQVWTGTEFKYRELDTEHGSAPGIVVPGPDGRTVYTRGDRFDDRGKVRGASSSDGPRLSLPTVEGTDFFLQVEETAGRPRLRLHLAADGLPLADLDQVELPKFAPAEFPNWLNYDQRLLLIPSAKLLVVIPEDDDQLELYRVDPYALLAKAKRHILAFASRPPTEVVKGAEFSYAPRVLSSKGGVKLTIEGGPEGMKLVDGTLTWKVPRDFDERIVLAVLVATDATGQEQLQSVRLWVND